MKKLVLSVICVLGVSALSMAQKGQGRIRANEPKLSEAKVSPAPVSTPEAEQKEGPKVIKPAVTEKKRAVRPVPGEKKVAHPVKKEEVIRD
ncbi:MAG: hypothetical protein EP333_04915 [Bacteroidetes bacterium]|nr:MAG: hypothetical protein EP333_04915 [Bacteroidota bacterium]